MEKKDGRRTGVTNVLGLTDEEKGNKKRRKGKGKKMKEHDKKEASRR